MPSYQAKVSKIDTQKGALFFDTEMREMSPTYLLSAFQKNTCTNEFFDTNIVRLVVWIIK